MCGCSFCYSSVLGCSELNTFVNGQINKAQTDFSVSGVSMTAVLFGVSTHPVKQTHILLLNVNV